MECFAPSSAPGAARSKGHAAGVVNTVLAFFLATTAATAASLVIQAYKFTSFGYPGASRTYASGINNSGEVVGGWQDSSGVAHGFVLNGDVFRSFDVPGALGTYPSRVNDAGIVVGSYTRGPARLLRDATGNLVLVCCDSYGFVRTPDGQVLTVHYPTTNSELPTTWLFDVNNAGQIVGGYNEFELAVPNSSSHGIHSFLFDGATFTLIDHPSAVASALPVTYAIGINDTGDIVGGYNDSQDSTRHGFVLRNGTFTILDMPRAPFTDLHDINNFGDIIGESLTCSSFSFLYTPKGGFSCIVGTPLGKPTLVPSLAGGLNNVGQIVGEAGGGSHLAYLASPPGINRNK